MYPVTQLHLGAEAWPLLNLDGHGQFRVRRVTRRFGFEVKVNELPSQPSLVFGILRADGAAGDARFAIRLDLSTGRVWDAAHDSGLLGELDPSDFPGREEVSSLCVRWQIQRTGDALIPQLCVGDEEFLYPAVRMVDEAPFVAFTGHDALELQGGDIFASPRVWWLDSLQ